MTASSVPASEPVRVAPEPADDGIKIGDIIRIIQRRWMVALPVFLAALGAAVARYRQVVPVYEAATSIRLDKKQPRVAGINPTPGISESNPLETEMYVLRSRALAAEVVARTAFGVRVIGSRTPTSSLFDSISVSRGAVRGEYEFLSQEGGVVRVTDPNGRVVAGQVGSWIEVGGVRWWPLPRMTKAAKVVAQVQPDDVAIGRLMGSLKVTQLARFAELLRLSVRDPDPRLAATATVTLAEVFTANQAARKQSGGQATIAFIRGQLDTLDRQLLEAEIRLRDWRAQQKVPDLTAQVGAAVSQRLDYEQKLNEKRNELTSLETLVRGDGQGGGSDSAQSRTRLRRVLSSPLMKENAQAGSILTSMLQLESQRAELRVRRTAQDPDVQVLDRTLADYELQGKMLVGNRLDDLRAEIAAYDRNYRKLGGTLQAAPGQELQLATLQRNTEVLSELQATLRTRLKEAEINNASNEATVEIVDRAEIPTSPVAPVLTAYLGVGLAAGAALAVLAALGVDRLDRTIHSREDIEGATGAPLVGLIPTFVPPQGLLGLGIGGTGKGGKGKGGTSGGTALTAASNGRKVIPLKDATDVIAITTPRHVSAEAYRMLRTNLRFAPADRPNRVLSVSSPSPGDGKSTTVVNYAATIAVQGKKVLVVDGDMRKGTLHQKLGITRTPGLSAVLSGSISIPDAVRTIQLTEGVLLDVITAGDAPPNPTELLGGSALTALVAWGREHYDQVILDTPPVNMFADSLLIAAASDSMLLVGRAGKSFKEELQVAAEQLRSLNVRMAGVVLNDFDARRDGRFGGYYYYERYQYKYYAAYVEDPEPERETT